jgi:hypothetical protein
MRRVILSLFFLAAALAGAVPANAAPSAGIAERPTDAAALALARQTGERVAITDRRTETADVFANPNGTLTLVTGDRLAWTSVWKIYPSTSFFNRTSESARVGHENDSGNTVRSLFRMDTSAVKGGQILSARFRTFETHSWSCIARPVEVWRTGAIDAATTWNNQPAWITKLDTLNVAKGYNSACPDGNVDFNVLAAVRDSAAAGTDDVTLGLRATNEADTYGWKRFDNNPVLIVDFTAP